MIQVYDGDGVQHREPYISADEVTAAKLRCLLVHDSPEHHEISSAYDAYRGTALGRAVAPWIYTNNAEDYNCEQMEAAVLKLGQEVQAELARETGNHLDHIAAFHHRIAGAFTKWKDVLERFSKQFDSP